MRRVRLLKAWQDWQDGHVFTDMPQSSADLLVERGFAEYLDEQVERAPVDRMLRARRPEREARKA
jgi:hypothetical protein